MMEATARKKLWIERNREHIREYDKLYYKTEKNKEYRKRYFAREDVKEKIKNDNIVRWEKIRKAKAPLRGRIRKDPLIIKFNDRRRRLGLKISFEEYQKMVLNQGNLCAICSQSEKGKALAIDHCHKTGRIRGLLCQRCNRGLGSFKDEISYLQRAISYLGT